MKFKDTENSDYFYFQDFVGNSHKDYVKYDTSENVTEVYLLSVDAPKAFYHGRFGKPADIDAVWAEREKCYEE